MTTRRGQQKSIASLIRNPTFLVSRKKLVMAGQRGKIAFMILSDPIHPLFFKEQRLRLTLLTIMVAAFFFGFADLIANRNFERLHIFLFNLCSGGFVVLYHTENTARPSIRSLAFLVLSLLYAIFAFLQIYLAAAVLSLALAALVESIRLQKFPFLPRDLFSFRTPVVDKFHHASILCLSLSLVIAAFVVVNNDALHWIANKNMTLNLFFLGYSFPLSLMSMSVMFSFTQEVNGKMQLLLTQVFFWFITLGVVVFFLFILADLPVAKFIIATALFLVVAMMLVFFLRYGRAVQQKHFLASGMFFLLGTGISGVAYIVLSRFPEAYQNYGRLLLNTHSYLALYGWSLSGLLVLIRWNDFPLRVNSLGAISLHWVALGVFAPLGKINLTMAAITILLYLIFLRQFFQRNSD